MCLGGSRYMCRIRLDIFFVMQDTGTGKKKHWLSIWYLSVDMQNYILNSSVLLDECQSSLRTQTGNLVAVVTAQQDAQVNKLVEINCK